MRTCHELRRPAPRALPTLTRLAAVCLLTTAAGLVGCSSGSGDSNETNSGPSIAPPDPNGVMLPGDPSDPALGELIDMQPSPVAPADVLDGLLTTRLEALFAPGVTVQEVNDALAANDAAIVSMSAGFPAVSLVVPAAADENEAQMRADALAATPAFGAVTISYATVEAPIVAPLLGGGGGGVVSTALSPARMEAAKNAADLLGVGSARLPVVVADEFAELTPSPLISAQSFPDPNGETAVGFSGNRGFFAAGVIGADEDPNSDLDIVHPRAGDSLDIRCAPMSGLTWLDRVQTTVYALDAASGPVVLYTGVTYEPSAVNRSKGWRATDALYWRHLMSSRSVTFVHVQPAGDHGLETGELREARWCSPYALSESAVDLSIGLTGPDLEQVELAALALGAIPQVGRLRVVGSRETDPSMGSVWSSPGADLTMVGEAVEGLCVLSQLGCQNGSYPAYSTRAAAAQVAGIYAYLWGIRSTLSATELLDIVDNAYFSGVTPNVVDAYQAVLALDPSLGSAAVRPELLDVAAGTDVYSEIGDGVFDDHDIAVFVSAFDPQVFLQGASNDPVFDLNGDGEVGGMGTRPFDLDVNVPPVFSNVEGFYGTEPVPFDETAMTDLEIVCYYSLTDLFVGDTARRDQLLDGCLPVSDPVEVTDFSIDGRAEAEIGSTVLFEEYDLQGQNMPASASITVVDQGTASAEISQSGVTIAGGPAGIDTISVEGHVEGDVNAIVPSTGGLYGQAYGDVRFDVILNSAAMAGTVALTVDYSGITTTPGMYAYTELCIEVDPAGPAATYTYEVEFDENSGPFNDSQVVSIPFAPGESNVSIRVETVLGDNSVPIGSLLDASTDLDWTFELTF